jgi:hypothetical protein
VAEPLTKTYERWRAGMIKSRLGQQKSSPQPRPPYNKRTAPLDAQPKVTGTAVLSRLTDPAHIPIGAPCHPFLRGRQTQDGEDNATVVGSHRKCIAQRRFFAFLFSSIQYLRQRCRETVRSGSALLHSVFVSSQFDFLSSIGHQKETSSDHGLAGTSQPPSALLSIGDGIFSHLP